MQNPPGMEIMDVIVRYRYEGTVHQVRFGPGGWPIPCSIYFDCREAQRVRDVLGENSMTSLPVGGGWDPEEAGGAAHSVLDKADVERLGLTGPARLAGGGPVCLCWHSCMCDWWCPE
jgi:hypothetical protein